MNYQNTNIGTIETNKLGEVYVFAPSNISKNNFKKIVKEEVSIDHCFVSLPSIMIRERTDLNNIACYSGYRCYHLVAIGRAIENETLAKNKTQQMLEEGVTYLSHKYSSNKEPIDVIKEPVILQCFKQQDL